MILADKIIELRKKHQMTQEDLAERLGVSRQSISKWEGAQSLPDLNKIVKLAKTFGVSTDYLLDDDMVSEDGSEADFFDEDSVTVSLEMVHQYLADKREFAHRIALGVVFLISSVIPLIALTTPATQRILPGNIGEGLGLGLLFLLIAVGVGVIIFTNMRMHPYEFLEKQEFELDYGVKGFLEKERENYRPTHMRLLSFGVGMVLLSVIPLVTLNLIFPNFGQAYAGYIVGIFLAILSLAIYMLINTGVYWSSFSTLLNPDRQAKASEERESRIAGVYWPVVTALFLGYSFITNDWGRSWIIWPIAGVTFAAVVAIYNFRQGEQ